MKRSNFPFSIIGDSDEDEYKQRGRRQRAKVSRSTISNDNSNAVAAFTQPPKERPDAKHHLKVFYVTNQKIWARTLR